MPMKQNRYPTSRSTTPLLPLLQCDWPDYASGQARRPRWARTGSLLCSSTQPRSRGNVPAQPPPRNVASQLLKESNRNGPTCFTSKLVVQGSSLDRVGLVRRVGLAGHLVFS